MNKKINVLSLFDGISVGRLALERANINVGTYYASEIDKYATKISEYNYPDIVRLGDITKWNEWDIDFSSIDLLLAGFPCQSWSVAGKQKGDNDPRGALVHDLLDVWSECKKHNTDVKFLFENVKMKKEFISYINDLFGVKSIEINSALVSAQNRRRLYWTNIESINQPKDKGILLKDIIDLNHNEKYVNASIRTNKEYSKSKNDKTDCLLASCYKGIGNNGMPLIEKNQFVDREKSHCIDANYFKGGNLKSYFEKHRRQLVFSKYGLCHVGDADIKGHDSIKRVYSIEGKSPTLTMQGGNQQPKILCGAIRGRYTKYGKRQDHLGSVAGKTIQQLEVRCDGKTNTLTTVQKDNNVV